MPASPFAAVPRTAAASAAAWPWRSLLGVPLAALLYTLTTPPHAWALAGWIAPGVFLASIRRHRPAAAVAIGAAFGLLAAWGVTGWVPDAALRYFDADRVRATAVGAALWIWSGGVSFALLAGTYAIVARRTRPMLRPLVAAWLWVAVEWFRSTACTGLPWTLLAHGQFRHPRVIAIAALGGAYAVTFLMVAVSVGVAEYLAHAGGGRRRLRHLALPALLGSAALAYGAVAPAQDGAARTVLLVQANRHNELRWSRAALQDALGAQLRLTADATADVTPDLIVWPENAVDFYLETEPRLQSVLARSAARSRAGLVFGGPRLVGETEARNAAYLLAPTGTIAGVWDKHRLVPFAEYHPWATPDADGPVYRPGTDGGPLAAGGDLRLGVFICYEALFAPLVGELVRGGATLLVSPSNDSWLDGGDGAGPWQLFAAAVFRAVETRRWLVRAATTGISAAVAPDGTIVEHLATGVAGTLLVRVHERSDRTPYSYWGDAWIAVAGAALLATARRRRPRSVA